MRSFRLALLGSGCSIASCNLLNGVSNAAPLPLRRLPQGQGGRTARLHAHADNGCSRSRDARNNARRHRREAARGSSEREHIEEIVWSEMMSCDFVTTTGLHKTTVLGSLTDPRAKLTSSDPLGRYVRYITKSSVTCVRPSSGGFARRYLNPKTRRGSSLSCTREGWWVVF